MNLPVHSSIALRTLLAALALLAGLEARVSAQENVGTLRIRVESEAGGAPLADAEVRGGGGVGRTDAEGMVTLRLPAGEQEIRVSLLGYGRVTIRILVAAGAETFRVIALEEEALEGEEIVVQSTRTERRIEDEPIRVEVIAREEIEEKMLMSPGDISMLLSETSGLRVQVTSPSLGGANVRIHGLLGRYTQILSDGLPLYGGQSGALSMLQIPPMDLAQVEVIKGVASALYGASALGGVVNLISRRPDGERELLLNQTTRGGSDAILWSTGELSERWGYTFLGSGHRQGVQDVNEDGWADIPGFLRATARPRVFWSDGEGRSLFVTVGGTAENREGGTVPGRTTPAGTPYAEALDTRRIDAGVVGRVLLPGERLLTVRGAAMRQQHDHRFGPVSERDVHTTGFGEVAVTGGDRGRLWVVGAALQREGYANREVSRFDEVRTTPSAFVQYEISPVEWGTAALSGRMDAPGDFSPIFNPRLSILLRPGGEWTSRLSLGTGYFLPTPFTEETEVLGLSPVRPLDAIEVERARSASLDIGRMFGHIEVNGTLFGSEIRDPLLVRRVGDGTVELLNAPEPTRTWGTDLIARFHEEPFHITATWTLTRSTEAVAEGDARRVTPLTPRHAAGLVGIWESEGEARAGIELYYVGRQELEENPYRSRSRPYLNLGVLAEKRVGAARVFINAENILDVRQSRWDPLLLPERTREGRWTTDVWAPLDGRVLNAGVRWAF